MPCCIDPKTRVLTLYRSGGQWRSKGGKWGHAPWSAGLGGAPAHFLQS